MATADNISGAPHRAGWSKILGDTWNLYVSNPSLLAPPVLAGFVNLCLYSIFGYIFYSSLKSLAVSIYALDSVRVLPQLLSRYMIVMIVILVLARTFINVFHQAGWSAMFSAAAREEITRMDDYFDGIVVWSPRFFAGFALKLCIHAIPALFFAVVAMAILVLNKKFGSAVVLWLVSVPITLFLEAIIFLALNVWKPVLMLENMNVVESFSRSGVFFRRRLGDLLLVWLLRGLYAGVVCAVFLGGGFLLVKSLAGDAAHLALRISLIANAALLAWLFLAVGAGFFSLLLFVLYRERVLAEDLFEPPFETLPQSAIANSVPLDKSPLVKPPAAQTTAPVARPVVPPAAPPSAAPIFPRTAPPGGTGAPDPLDEILSNGAPEVSPAAPEQAQPRQPAEQPPAPPQTQGPEPAS